jgi:hypothetical protein
MLVELAAVDKAVWSCMDDLTEKAEPRTIRLIAVIMMRR